MPVWNHRLVPLLVLLPLLSGCNHDDDDDDDDGPGFIVSDQWEPVPLTGPIAYTDPAGRMQTLMPSCSGGPVCTDVEDPTTCRPGNTQFSLFLRQGDPRRLAVLLDGGGACWDSNNCLAVPTYNPEINETPESLQGFGGVGDLDNPENPLHDWTLVFVPYCTGDTHWGSKDTVYRDLLGRLGPPGGEVTLHHRGVDNFLAVLDFIRHHYDDEALPAVEELLVAGASAGGYGTLLAFPHLREAMADAEAKLLSDAAAGVITRDFFEEALFPPPGQESAWGLADNLPPWVPGATDLETAGPDGLVPGMITALAQHYTDTEIGQFNRVWDATQVGFLNVMRHIDNPTRWASPDPALFCEFNLKVQQFSLALAANPNYRFYLGAGTDHDILPTPEFYTETASGVVFDNWTRDMLAEPPGVAWVNTQCIDCDPPFDPSLCAP